MSMYYDNLRSANRRRNAGCKGCKHLSAIWTCDYLSHTGRSRVFAEGAPTYPGGGCDLKQGKCEPPPHQPQILSKKVKKAVARQKSSALEGSLAEVLYYKGATDLQISVALHCSKKTVQNWRLITGRPSNQPRGKNYRYNKEDTENDNP